MAFDGLSFIVAAIEGEQFDERGLAVTDGNLATMYAGDGNVQQLRPYARLASRAEAAETTLR